MAVSNLSILQKKKNKGWSGSLTFPFFSTIIALKLVGFVGSSVLMVMILLLRTSEANLALQIPEVDWGLDLAFRPSLSPTSPTVSATDRENLFDGIHSPDVTETRVITMNDRPNKLITNTPILSVTPEYFQTLPATVIPATAFIPTLTNTFTPTITPFVSTFNGMMQTPLKGIGFSDLKMIISQPFIQGIETRDIGHYAVDLGSYDYKGKNIINWPILAVFSGKVASVVNDRPPLGNSLIIETPYSEIPEKIVELIGIKPDQSLYHLYGHMIENPTVEIGNYVKSGDLIGHVGKSSTVEAHLHFETRIGPPNIVFDSLAYYSGDITPDEKTNYERFRMSGEFRSFDPMLIFNNAQK
jgi:murein DD-endopeptidase MepM/ murein hydrolase activator NlpD